MEITISDEELQSLILAIRKRYGVDFTCYEPKSLKRRVVRCITAFKLTSVHDLWVQMLRDPDFIRNFMNEISVGLTAMFRDPILWKTLKLKVLKTLAEKGDVNIWHAGCSTGEEVYTMGIVLKEAGLNLNVKALATDISEAAIETALTGRYHKIKLVEYEKNYAGYQSFGNFTKYYQRLDENHGVMDTALIRHVNFKYHNLITDPLPGKFDIIFCRNVMIYFDHIAKTRLIKQFHDSLNPGGYFITGFYDTMHTVVDKADFKVYDESTRIFCKLDKMEAPFIS